MLSLDISMMHARVISVLKNCPIKGHEDILAYFAPAERPSAGRAFSSLVEDDDLVRDESGVWSLRRRQVKPKPIDYQDFRDRVLTASRANAAPTRMTILAAFSLGEQHTAKRIIAELLQTGALIKRGSKLIAQNGFGPALETTMPPEPIIETAPGSQEIAAARRQAVRAKQEQVRIETEAAEAAVAAAREEQAGSVSKAPTEAERTPQEAERQAAGADLETRAVANRIRAEAIGAVEADVLRIANAGSQSISSIFEGMAASGPTAVAEAIRELAVDGMIRIDGSGVVEITAEGRRALADEELGLPVGILALMDEKRAAPDAARRAKKAAREKPKASAARILSPFDIRVITSIERRPDDLAGLQRSFRSFEPALIAQTVEDFVAYEFVSADRGAFRLTAAGRTRLELSRLGVSRRRAGQSGLPESLEARRPGGNQRAERHAEDVRTGFAARDSADSSEHGRISFWSTHNAKITGQIRALLDQQPVISRKELPSLLGEYPKTDVDQAIRALQARGVVCEYGTSAFGLPVGFGVADPRLAGIEPDPESRCTTNVLETLRAKGALDAGQLVSKVASKSPLEVVAAIDDLVSKGHVELIGERVVRLRGDSLKADSNRRRKAERANHVQLLKQEPMRLTDLMARTGQPKEIITQELTEAMLLGVVRQGRGAPPTFVHADHAASYDLAAPPQPRPWNLLARLEPGLAYEVESLRNAIGWMVNFDADIATLEASGQIAVVTLLRNVRAIVRKDADRRHVDNPVRSEPRVRPISLKMLVGDAYEQVILAVQNVEPAPLTTAVRAVGSSKATQNILALRDLGYLDILPDEKVDRYILSDVMREAIGFLREYGDREQAPPELGAPELRRLQEKVERFLATPFMALLMKGPMTGAQIQSELELTRGRVQQLTAKGEDYGLVRPMASATEVGATFVSYRHFDDYASLDFETSHIEKRILSAMRVGSIYAAGDLAVGCAFQPAAYEQALEGLKAKGLIGEAEGFPARPMRRLGALASVPESEDEAELYGFDRAYGQRRGQVIRTLLFTGALSIDGIVDVMSRSDKKWTFARVAPIVRRLKTANLLVSIGDRGPAGVLYDLEPETRKHAQGIEAIERHAERTTGARPVCIDHRTMRYASGEPSEEARARILEGVIPGKAYMPKSLAGIVGSSRGLVPTLDALVKKDLVVRIEFDPERFIYRFSSEMENKAGAVKATPVTLDMMVGYGAADMLTFLAKNGPSTTAELVADARSSGRRAVLSTPQTLMLLRKRGLVLSHVTGVGRIRLHMATPKGLELIELVRRYGVGIEGETEAQSPPATDRPPSRFKRVG